MDVCQINSINNKLSSNKSLGALGGECVHSGGSMGASRSLGRWWLCVEDRDSWENRTLGSLFRRDILVAGKACWVWLGLLVHMAGAGRGELVGIDEESPVGVTGVNGDHPVVDILLCALALVTGSEEPAGAVGSETGLKPGSLGVVVLAVAVLLGDVLKDNAPVALNVDSALDLGVVDDRGAEVALGAGPVGKVKGRGALGGAGVVLVVKGVLLISGDVVNQVVSRLVGHVGVLLQEDGILADLVSDLVLGVLGVLQTEGKVGVEGTRGRGLRITVCWGVAVGWAMRSRMGCAMRCAVGRTMGMGRGVGSVGRRSGMVGAGSHRHDGDGSHGNHQCGYL
jgi:hypothetical protein